MSTIPSSVTEIQIVLQFTKLIYNTKTIIVDSILLLDFSNIVLRFLK